LQVTSPTNQKKVFGLLEPMLFRAYLKTNRSRRKGAAAAVYVEQQYIMTSTIVQPCHCESTAAAAYCT
jgi:hypothetical protein